jgi:hypothetical protein
MTLLCCFNTKYTEKNDKRRWSYRDAQLVDGVGGDGVQVRESTETLKKRLPNMAENPAASRRR